jgi:hypothetical protein
VEIPPKTIYSYFVIVILYFSEYYSLKYVLKRAVVSVKSKLSVFEKSNKDGLLKTSL